MNHTHLHSRRPRSDMAQEIGTRIRERRDALGLTVAEVSRALGLSNGAVSQYETGRAVPKQEKIEALAEVLGTSPEWLMTGHEPEHLGYAQNAAEIRMLALMRRIPARLHPIVLAAVKGIADVEPSPGGQTARARRGDRSPS
ncbi:helix-turn-helix domain-containing protein [Gluconacetobacter sp. 1c LMG 22058]|uniref:Helix-turn-helix domain-containing protein n=1 Tax=Gluconacetobacter dulcium TaxID=2729096 RepID=A0A7W4PJ96_9PROT|nr:helix-turn-helix domain-containing protein [Gluconacetobacter dulcium]MBB2199523.1 helix-turn-helix domain-containing protein [Gluconacetobacter dulcium]